MGGRGNMIVDLQPRLPIDVRAGTQPPIFLWRQSVDTLNGRQCVDHEGSLPPTVEKAVEALVTLAKRLVRENMVMRATINMTVDRLGGVVEGKPTHEGNFLQRVDELVRIEAVAFATTGTTDTRAASTQVSVKGKGRGT